MDQLELSPDKLLEMKIERLLRRWPAASQVLITHRMACIGCDFAGFHTTTQALEIYNLEPEPFLQDLKEALTGSRDGSNSREKNKK